MSEFDGGDEAPSSNGRFVDDVVHCYTKLTVTFVLPPIDCPVPAVQPVVPVGTFKVSGDAVLRKILKDASITDLGRDRSIVARLVQNWNARSPMLVTLLPMVTLVRPEQVANAKDPMLVTLLGMVRLVSAAQPANALYPMLVTLSGMVTLVRPVQR